MEVAGQAGVVITTTTVQAATETGVELATLAGILFMIIIFLFLFLFPFLFLFLFLFYQY